MGFRDLLYETWHALTANKGRSALTVLGVVIGIAAVISMTSIIGGVQKMLVDELGLGKSRVLSINIMGDHDVTYDDLERMEESVDGFDFITGASYGYGESVTAGTRSASGMGIVGARPDYLEPNGVRIVQGSYYTDDDERGARTVCIISTNMVKTLFGSGDYQAVGKTIKIDDVSYTVVGVFESASIMSSGLDLYMPYSTMSTRITGMSQGIQEISGFASEGVDMDILTERSRQYLASYYNIQNPDDEIYIFSSESLMAQMNTTMNAFALLMAAVAGVSLFVGGIGIMNMMLTNVTERIREIGLRKSLGARRRDITRQFLLEAVGLCVIGGVVGILAGYLGSWGIAAIVGIIRPDLSITPAVSVSSILLAVGVCMLIGIVFGYYPARRAAKLNPVEALRYQ